MFDDSDEYSFLMDDPYDDLFDEFEASPDKHIKINDALFCEGDEEQFCSDCGRSIELCDC
jgi:hypothetical protein